MIFKAPIGTEEERNSGKVWPGQWFDATPYASYYWYGYHTGADLNNNSPRWDGDAHSEVYSIGDGMVIYAQLYSKKVWGNLIIIDHGTVDDKPLFSRYAHVEHINVSVGQAVHMGDQIAKVGNGEGLFPYHLHFDISTTTQLRSTPYYWPGEDKKSVLHHFVDPREWLRREHRVDGSALANNVLLNNTITDKVVQDKKPSATATLWHVIAPNGSSVRKDHGLSAEEVGLLPHGSKLSIEAGGGNQDGYTWGQISGGEFNGHWLAIKKEDQSETYVSTNPPRE